MSTTESNSVNACKKNMIIEVMKTNPQELLHDDSEYNFLKDVNHIEDVYFGKSVNMFQDLSELVCH